MVLKEIVRHTGRSERPVKLKRVVSDYLRYGTDSRFSCVSPNSPRLVATEAVT